MGKKLIITVALCGAGTKKSQTPYVPITPDEMAEDAVKCVKAGASIIHIHARDKDGNNDMHPEIFVEICQKIRAALDAEGLDAILNLTTSGSKFPLDMRLANLWPCMPEMCSYDPGSINWANSYVFLNPPQFLDQLGDLTQKLNIKPELEVFDGGFITTINTLLKKGKLQKPCHIQMVLGVTGGMPGNIDSVNYLLPKLPEGSTWSITGIGHAHMECMLAGLAAGADGLRVGLEDNIYMEKGVLATNESLVKRAADLGRLAGREIATAAEAREILGLVKQEPHYDEIPAYTEI